MIFQRLYINVKYRREREREREREKENLGGTSWSLRMNCSLSGEGISCKMSLSKERYSRADVLNIAN